MARPKSINPPKYRFHKRSGQAIVTIDGRDCYLGAHGTAESRGRYDKLIGEWLAHGRTLPAAAKPDEPPAGITIVELCDKYERWAKQEYGMVRSDAYQHARSTGYQKTLDVLRPLRQMFGRLPVAKF